VRFELRRRRTMASGLVRTLPPTTASAKCGATRPYRLLSRLTRNSMQPAGLMPLLIAEQIWGTQKKKKCWAGSIFCLFAGWFPILLTGARRELFFLVRPKRRRFYVRNQKSMWAGFRGLILAKGLTDIAGLAEFRVNGVGSNTIGAIIIIGLSERVRETIPMDMLTISRKTVWQRLPLFKARPCWAQWI